MTCINNYVLLYRFIRSSLLFVIATVFRMLQVKESEAAPLISDSLSKVENGGGVVDDEPLKVPMWSSKYSRE